MEIEVSRRLRILLVEDHDTVRQGLKLLIDREPDFEVVGEACDGAQAIERGALQGLDVVVMDLSMPGVSGVVATRRLKQLRPELPIVSLTRHADQTFLEELLRAGASAYVLKQSSHSELFRAIRAAATGQQYIDPALTHHLAAPFAAQERKRTGRGAIGPQRSRNRSVAAGRAGPQQQGDRRAVQLEQQDNRGSQGERHAQALSHREDRVVAVCPPCRLAA